MHLAPTFINRVIIMNTTIYLLLDIDSISGMRPSICKQTEEVFMVDTSKTQPFSSNFKINK